MLKFLLVILLVSCAHVQKDGGDKVYLYDVFSQYSREGLAELAPSMVTSSFREPPLGKMQDLFVKGQAPLKRVGILVFETTIQPTRGGLSEQDKVYLSEQGKQLLTEKMLSIWEQSFHLLREDIELVPFSRIKKSKFLPNYGLAMDDFIKVKRQAIAPDDIFYLPPGKNTTVFTVLNPRGSRDLSMALVPAYELMGGPKYSEHMKHAVNEVAKEYNLDAVLVVMSELNWTAAHVNKHSGEFIPEAAKSVIKASILVPFSSYHARLEKTGLSRDLPKINIPFRTYESKIEFPVLLTVAPDEQTFEHIERELLNPMLKTYNDQTQMTLIRLINDLKQTF